VPSRILVASGFAATLLSAAWVVAQERYGFEVGAEMMRQNAPSRDPNGVLRIVQAQMTDAGYYLGTAASGVSAVEFPTEKLLELIAKATDAAEAAEITLQDVGDWEAGYSDLPSELLVGLVSPELIDRRTPAEFRAHLLAETSAIIAGLDDWTAGTGNPNAIFDLQSRANALSELCARLLGGLKVQ
jgi:hypothetical protein